MKKKTCRSQREIGCWWKYVCSVIRYFLNTYLSSLCGVSFTLGHVERRRSFVINDLYFRKILLITYKYANLTGENKINIADNLKGWAYHLPPTAVITICRPTLIMCYFVIRNLFDSTYQLITNWCWWRSSVNQKVHLLTYLVTISQHFSELRQIVQSLGLCETSSKDVINDGQLYFHFDAISDLTTKRKQNFLNNYQNSENFIVFSCLPYVITIIYLVKLS